MKQRLKVPVFPPRIPYRKTCLQILSVQRYGVSDAKLVILPLGRDAFKHGIRKAEIELDGSVTTAVGCSRRFG